MKIRPSEIHYSQNSISNIFDSKSSHSGRLIGETLDRICEGSCSIHFIPSLTVAVHGGEWMTVDNRRLWVFKELERLEKCDNVDVEVGFSISSAKLTTTNGGVKIDVRRSSGGTWHAKPGSGISSHYQVVSKTSRYAGFDDWDFDFDRFTLNDDFDLF
ncbi:hypothetical protein DPMN_020382 [Dreissena polymorpha]|uniref:Uncharacterized protein n=1 Tax=Dreissena polymorpha TaxID=45954 RepID=A0A9D4NMF6_DREPO|nr:hypothetical protein DPMN_020382 [Dreissena polymorpha]